MDRQKNMRQVEALIVEGIQQSIRSLLPVKTILREYLNDDEGEGEGAEDEEEGEAEVVATKEAEVETKTETKVEKSVEPVVEEKPVETVPVVEPVPEANTQSVQAPKSSMKSTVTVNKEAGVESAPEVPEGQQTLVVDTEPTVSFTNMDTIFDSNNLEGNEIATHSMFEGGEVERIETIDAPPEPLDDFEDLDGSGNAIDFEEITA
jgi:hypothetical protein